MTNEITLPYESLAPLSSSTLINNANTVLEEGWPVKSGHRVQLGDALPWALQHKDERGYNYQLQSWTMVEALLSAYSQTSDERYLQPCVDIAVDWVEKHNDSGETLSPFAWHKLSVGSRAYRLAFILDGGTRTGRISAQQADALWASLQQHGSYLVKDENVIDHSNHGYFQVAGLLSMGRRFGTRSDDMARACECARKRLTALLIEDFAADGVHREHSPEYHKSVYETLRALVASGLVDDADTIGFIHRIEQALSWFVMPNGHLANFGDSHYRKIKTNATLATQKWLTDEMRYAVAGGKAGVAPSDYVLSFSTGGYFVARPPSESRPDDYSQNSYLAQITGFHSRTHKQADDLSFIWSDRGSDLLVDAGRYGYVGKTTQGSDLWKEGFWYEDPNRIYCESTAAHNALEFDETSYRRKGVAPYGVAPTRWTKTECGLIAVETETKQFGSVRHARMLVMCPRKWLLVFDWFHDNLQATHDVRQWFHLSPHLLLHISEFGYQAQVPGSQEPLQVTNLLSETQLSHPWFGTENPKQGWVSHSEKRIKPNYAFCYEKKNAQSGSFATLFSFTSTLTPDHGWSKVNTSGRKAQLRWTQDDGRHVLRFDRSGDDLVVRYR